jgi:hypothetical protein
VVECIRKTWIPLQETGGGTGITTMMAISTVIPPEEEEEEDGDGSDDDNFLALSPIRPKKKAVYPPSCLVLVHFLQQWW